MQISNCRGKANPFKLIASAALLMALAAKPASAHIIGGPMGGFGSGFEHPLLGGDHFLAMLAVGLWGAQMGGRSVWTLPATFPLIMCIGGVIGMLANVPMEVISIGISLSLLALGAAIAAEWKAPEAASLTIIALFALFHGYPHGKMAPNASDPAAYTVGFVVATGMIHLFGIALGFGLGRLYNGLVVRAIGGAIVLAGIYYLATGQF
ncbi:HupE/UreJ family protein [Allorhizobium sp. BGMRC 0089]|uniref:HupE/UreJ family protein n=1 Tax=Allorhizobium sonneratiae TaxID=2934936 RepID=UPI0020348484|nr:HupE/UreJ family protein [Allorhizobium sonneratiae]MCM2291333.1 HupE/UreJ family protein [Allorhizobium sonneratiae]